MRIEGLSAPEVRQLISDFLAEVPEAEERGPTRFSKKLVRSTYLETGDRYLIHPRTERTVAHSKIARSIGRLIGPKLTDFALIVSDLEWPQQSRLFVTGQTTDLIRVIAMNEEGRYEQNKARKIEPEDVAIVSMALSCLEGR